MLVELEDSGAPPSRWPLHQCLPPSSILHIELGLGQVGAWGHRFVGTPTSFLGPVHAPLGILVDGRVLDMCHSLQPLPREPWITWSLNHWTDWSLNHWTDPTVPMPGRRCTPTMPCRPYGRAIQAHVSRLQVLHVPAGALVIDDDYAHSRAHFECVKLVRATGASHLPFQGHAFQQVGQRRRKRQSPWTGGRVPWLRQHRNNQVAISFFLAPSITTTAHNNITTLCRDACSTTRSLQTPKTAWNALGRWLGNAEEHPGLIFSGKVLGGCTSWS